MKTNPNDSAFSLHEIKEYYNSNPTLIINHRGLTKREYFSAKAMQGLLANSYWANKSSEWNKEDGDKIDSVLVERSVSIADALITELNKAK